MDKKKLQHTLYKAAQWSWGLPQTLVGAGLYLKHRKARHFDYRGARVTAWDRREGVSLGRFIFVPDEKGRSRAAGGPDANCAHGAANSSHASDKHITTAQSEGVSDFLLDHEYGHSIQSLMLGPFYLLLVGAPSLAWNRIPYFDRRRKKKGKSYYSAVFERTANTLGARASGRDGNK